jgi:hypothetical protein
VEHRRRSLPDPSRPPGTPNAPPIARRYVRLAPSALVSAQLAVLGPRPWALRLVTLALHLSLRASVRRQLANADPELPVLVVGRARCQGRWGEHEYRVEYDAGPREVSALLPLDREGGLPELRVSGERTIEARAAAGFASKSRRACVGRAASRAARRRS